MILRLTVIGCLVGAVFCGGCNIMGFIAAPSAHERKIPAEYDLRQRQDEKILVFVDEGRGGNTSLDFRMDLSKGLMVFLEKKVRIPKENLIGFDEIAALRKSRPDFSILLPAQIGRQLGADLVLYLQIVDYGLYGKSQERYYNGNLISRSVLVESKTGKILWPVDGKVRYIRTRVELDVERANVNARLVKATSHITTRNFYALPWSKYDCSDEPSEHKTEWLSY